MMRGLRRGVTCLRATRIPPAIAITWRDPSYSTVTATTNTISVPSNNNMISSFRYTATAATASIPTNSNDNNSSSSNTSAATRPIVALYGNSLYTLEPLLQPNMSATVYYTAEESAAIRQAQQQMSNNSKTTTEAASLRPKSLEAVAAAVSPNPSPHSTTKPLGEEVVVPTMQSLRHSAHRAQRGDLPNPKQHVDPKTIASSATSPAIATAAAAAETAAAAAAAAVSAASSVRRTKTGDYTGRLPRFTVQPVLRYPIIVTRPLSSEVSSSISSNKRHISAATKEAEMVMLEVVEHGYDISSSSSISNNNNTSECKPEVRAVHHIAVFKEGSIVSFGLCGEALDSVIEKVLSPLSEPKDPMLVADARAIALSGGSEKEGGITIRCTFTTVDELPSLGYAVSPEYEANAITSSYVDVSSLDAVVLRRNDPLTILPFVFCFSELVMLKALNALALPIKERVSLWQQHVEQHGTLPMSLKEARVLKAKLMRLDSRQSKVAGSRHRVLWEDHHAQARQIFLGLIEHYEVNELSESFRNRVEVLENSLNYLCDEAHTETDERLEWVIILLIMVEVYLAIDTHYLSHGHGHEGEQHTSTTDKATMTEEPHVVATA